MAKRIKNRSMSMYGGPLNKMIDDAVALRMSALKAKDGEEKVVATRQGTNVDKGDGSGNFTRTTETDYQTKTRKNLPTYKEAWEQMTPQEKERFGSFEGFVKEAGEKPATEDQTTEISNRTESKTREFAPTPDPGLAIYSDPGQQRIVVDAEGNTTVVDRNTSGTLEKLQSKISSLQEKNKPIPDHLIKRANKLGGVESVMGSKIHTPTRENAELYGVDFNQIGNQFEKDGVVISEHNYKQNNPNLQLDDFGRVPVGNNNDRPDYVEVPYTESSDQPNPENTVGQFKMNRNTSSKGQSSMIKNFGKPMAFRKNR